MVAIMTKAMDPTKKKKDQFVTFAGSNAPRGQFDKANPVAATNPKATTTSPQGITYNPNYSAGAVTRALQSGDLVENRINSLTQQDSPYMQVARQAGLDWAANRGAANSSMAAGASQREAIKSALPIASQDATTSFTQGLSNQQARQQTSQSRIEGEIQTGLIGEQARHQGILMEQQAAIDRELQRTDLNAAERRLLLQEQARMAQLIQQGQIEQRLIGVQGNVQQRLNLQQSHLQRQETAQQGAIQRGLQAHQGQLDQRLQAQGIQGQLRLGAQELSGNLRLQSQRGAIESNLMRLDGQIQRNMQLLRGDQAVQLANIEARWKERLQGSASAAEVMSQSMTQIGAIMSNQELSAAQQQAGVNRVIDQVRSSLTVIEGYGATEITNPLNFGQGGTRPGTQPRPPAARPPAATPPPGGGGNTPPPGGNTGPPQNGEQRTINGINHVFHNGRWIQIAGSGGNQR